MARDAVDGRQRSHFEIERARWLELVFRHITTEQSRERSVIRRQRFRVIEGGRQ
jgi:hypothetical protein